MTKLIDLIRIICFSRRFLYILLIILILAMHSHLGDAQTLMLKSQKGWTKKSIRPGDEVYFKLKPQYVVKIPVSGIDSLCRVDGVNSRKPVVSRVELTKLPSPILLTTFSAIVLEINKNNIGYIPVSFDSLTSEDIRFWPERSYEINFKEECGYKELELDKIRMIYVRPGWRNAAYSITSIAGIAITLISPVLSIKAENAQIDYLRTAKIAGAGISLYVFSKLLRKRLMRSVGYFTTNAEDRVNISKRYKVVTLETK